MNLGTIKNAVMTAAMVLAVIYVARQTTIGQSLVTKALAG